MADELTRALEIVVNAIADRVVARLAEASAGMIAQDESPLGARRHCSAVRKLVAKGTPGAAIVGRRYLLSRDLVAAELAKISAKVKVHPPSGALVEEAELDRMLASVGMVRVKE